MDLGERLRADVPVLEPDPVLLAQLVQLSVAAGPGVPVRRSPGVLAVVAAAGAAVILSGTAWLAGALPGTVSPLHPSHHGHSLPSQHSSSPVPRHASSPIAPGATGSAGVPEDPASATAGSTHPVHPSHPVHPTHPAHPTHPVHPTRPAHPSASGHPSPRAHPTHPAHRHHKARARPTPRQ